jgi:hypothetical protein
VLKKLLEQLGKVTPFGVDIENAVEHQDHCLPSRREKSCAHFRQFFMGPLKNVFQRDRSRPLLERRRCCKCLTSSSAIKTTVPIVIVVFFGDLTSFFVVVFSSLSLSSSSFFSSKFLVERESEH